MVGFIVFSIRELFLDHASLFEEFLITKDYHAGPLPEVTSGFDMYLQNPHEPLITNEIIEKLV